VEWLFHLWSPVSVRELPADGDQDATGWGYEALVREVSDSLHLRRFCRIALTGASCD
jgi:hypothetical protein